MKLAPERTPALTGRSASCSASGGLIRRPHKPRLRKWQLISKLDRLDHAEAEPEKGEPATLGYHALSESEECDWIESQPAWFQDLISSIQEAQSMDVLADLGKRIEAAEQTGYNVLIIDSLSHAWAGAGGILDIKDHIAKSTRTQNDFAAWREATPKHNELVDTILKSSLHLIVTLRTKTGYEIAQDDKGKTRVQKLGLAFVQREGLEYEFTVVLDLSIDGHTATSTKDRTRLFDGKYFTPTEETGRQLLSWLTTGADPHAAAISEVTGILGSLNLQELSDAYWLYVSRKYGISSVTDLTQQQLLEQSTILKQCHRSPERLEQFRQLLGNTPPFRKADSYAHMAPWVRWGD